MTVPGAAAGATSGGLGGRSVTRRLGLYAAISTLVGVLAGAWWRLVAHRPAYVLGDRGRATTGEGGIAGIFDMDAWFALIGIVGGLVLGVLAWLWFRRIAVMSALLATAGSLLAAGLAWATSLVVETLPFAERLAHADAGAAVPVDLTLRSSVAIAVWVLAAMLPVLGLSLLDDRCDQQRRETPGTATGHDATPAARAQVPTTTPRAGAGA